MIYPVINRRRPARRPVLVASLGRLGFYIPPSQAAYYSAASTGSSTDNYGTTTYDPGQNDLLAPAEATTGLPGVNVTQPIAPQATAAAAAQIAAALGGQVVPLPNNTTWAGSVTQYAIQMPDGRILDATAVANVIGNNAAFPGAAQKQAAIDSMVDARYQPTGFVTQGNPTGTATIPAGAAKPSSSSTPSAQPAAQAAQPVVIVTPTYHPTITLENLTTGRGNRLVAGRDRWRLTIRGAAPNVPVKVTAVRNSALSGLRRRGLGDTPSTTVYGTTDASGNWTMTGTSTTADIGSWAQTWYAGVDQAGSLSFDIAADTSPSTGSSSSSTGSSSSGASTPVVTPTYSPRITIQNLTTGNPGVIVAGVDTWQLQITGAPPSVPVVVTATKIGGLISTSSPGTTDAQGNWSLTGKSSLSDVGTWMQNWSAGNVQAGSLSFAIVAPATSSSSGSTTSTLPTAASGSTSAPSTGTPIPAGGMLTDLISSLPDPIANVAKTVQAAAADIPSAWLWAGAIGALVLFSKKRR